MAVLQCVKGHYYDGDKFAECPHCKNPPPAVRRGIGEGLTEYRPSKPSPAGPAPRGQIAIDLGGPPKPGDERTVGVFRTEKGHDPVVGWLVCVRGREAGRDWRLHAGRNFVGRAMNSDIALVDDERITRENHCSIVFEPRQGLFMLARGLGDGVVVNGERLADSRQLCGDEVLEIGSSAFVFIPFCKEGRTW